MLLSLKAIAKIVQYILLSKRNFFIFLIVSDGMHLQQMKVGPSSIVHIEIRLTNPRIWLLKGISHDLHFTKKAPRISGGLFLCPEHRYFVNKFFASPCV